jgi:LytTr DNA-binding domain
MTLPALGEARKDGLLATLISSQRLGNYGLAIGVGFLLAVSGAFETSVLPLLQRLGFWLPIMLAGSMIGAVVSDRVLAISRWASSRVLVWGLVTLLVAIPMTLIVWGVTGLMIFGKVEIGQLQVLAPNVMLVSAFMAGVLTFLNQTPAVTHIKPSGSQPPRFLDRLPLKLRGAQIYAVSSEDHYLRIHTSRGSDMILMRLSDAIVELDGIEGCQVHRSWWVARDAVETVERGEGKAVFTLKGGIRAPVSRTFAKALREANWY